MVLLRYLIGRVNIVGLDVMNTSCLTWICRVSARKVDRPDQQCSISQGLKFHHFFYIRLALHDSQFKISQTVSYTGPWCRPSLHPQSQMSCFLLVTFKLTVFWLAALQQMAETCGRGFSAHRAVFLRWPFWEYWLAMSSYIAKQKRKLLAHRGYLYICRPHSLKALPCLIWSSTIYIGQNDKHRSLCDTEELWTASTTFSLQTQASKRSVSAGEPQIKMKYAHIIKYQLNNIVLRRNVCPSLFTFCFYFLILLTRSNSCFICIKQLAELVA